MTDFAIIKKGTQQYALEKGKFIDVPKLEGKIGDKIDFDQVLLARVGEELKIGQPLVEKAKVSAKIVKTVRTKKQEAMKFKAKSRYRKHWGFRQTLTRIVVESITL